MSTLRFATRGSALALAQTQIAIDSLHREDPALETAVVEVRTEGDRDRSTPLTVLGGRGVFVRAIEEALREGRADVSVHSLKDVPTEPAPGLVLAAVLPRGDPRDALVAAAARRLADLPAGARVGTSSQRRVALLRMLRPDLELADVRGNIDTRMRRVAEGDYDAVVLAAAGLERLRRLEEATQIFEAMEFIPAPGQGAIALQCREDDDNTRRRLAVLDNPPARAAVEAERGFLAALGSGCSLPVGAYAQIDEGLLVLRAMLGGEDGAAPRFGDATGPVDQAEALGRELGKQLLAAGTAGERT